MHKLLPFIDHTILKPEISPKSIQEHLEEHQKTISNCAGFCTWYPLFEVIELNTNKIAVAGGFPFSRNSDKAQLFKIEEALTLGVNEIDITLNHGAIEDGNFNKIAKQIAAARALTSNHTLKVILETGVLNANQINTLTLLCLENQVDFVKTSSGMRGEGATLQAVESILKVMKNEKSYAGLKVSGGVRTIDEAEEFLDLVAEYFQMITPDNFRIGSSSLALKL